MPLPLGAKIGPYLILSELGAGGMGEVYRGRDTKLDREVAIKVLPASVARDPERLARFEREAKVLASLNHPNIAQIYGVQEAEGYQALVMELVPGQTLAAHIETGAIPLDESLRLAGQMVEALSAAHEKGITHRDFKPANVMITPEGVVKVLDFGLAAVSQPNDAPTGTNVATLTMSPTSAGMIMGTAPYMSPEQARGNQADRRSDIFSFGVVLYEMLTGKQLFHGETVSDILASVLKDAPNLDDVPEQVRPLLQRCLQKDPRKRLQSIGDWDLLLAIGSGASGLGVQAAVSAPSQSRFGAVILVAALATLAAVGLAFIHFRETPPEQRRLNLSVLPSDGTTFDFSNFALPALSPDGTRMVFGARGASGRTQLWVRRMDSGIAQALPGTEDGFLPFWSPDSQYIGFCSGLGLKKIDIAGGPPIALANLPAPLRGGTWSHQGVIIYSVNGPNGLFQIPAAGGTPTSATSFDAVKEQTGHRFPWFLPDGRHFLYISSRTGDIPVLVGSLDDPKSPGKQLALANSNAIYSDGQLLYLRESTLMAQPFDPVKLVTTGEAKPIAEGVNTYMQPSRVAGMTVSATGLLAIETGVGANMARSQLVWMDRSGKSLGAVGDFAQMAGGGIVDSLELSPDQKSLAVALGANGGANIWIVDLARGVPTRFTLTPNAFESSPVWSTDGSTLFWHSNRKEQMFRKASNGIGTEQPVLAASNANAWPTSVSPDGKFLLYSSRGGGTRGALIWPLEQSGDGKSQQLASGTAAQARFSPDGKWVVYQSVETGLSEIYAAPFPGPGGERPISTGGGYSPRWRRDGKEIFYSTADNHLVATEVAERNGTLEIGKTQVLFGGMPKGGVSNQVYYDVSADGKKFIVTQGDTRDIIATPVTVIQNWTAGLKK